MKIIQPSRLTFWRLVFIFTAALSFLSIDQVLGSAAELGVDLSVSAAWKGLIVILGLIGLVSLLLFTSTWSRFRERILSFAELPERAPNRNAWLGILLITAALTGFTVLFMIPMIQSLFGGMGWMRFLMFWSFSLVGMWGIKSLSRETPWLIALITIVLCQSTLHLLLVYWPRVTTYPFAMGWSETSRFYYPSLFLSGTVSSLLAGGDPVYFGGRSCPCVDDAAFHPGTRGALAGRFMDFPLFVHGAGLFPFDDPGHSCFAGILPSG